MQFKLLLLGLIWYMCISVYGKDVEQQPLAPENDGEINLAFAPTWQLLGPFQIGTREAQWGADPLEYHDGFRSLKYDPEATFKSSLSPNGTAGWSTIKGTGLSTPLGSMISLSISFPNVDWHLLQSVYGWAALQYQAWARGELLIEGEHQQTILLYTDHVLEFRVDGELHFGGDFYGLRKVPLVLHLEPGIHTIDLRLIRDVRAMSGVGEPTIEVELRAHIESEPVGLANPLLISDVVDGRLASSLASVGIRNNGQFGVLVMDVTSKSDAAAITLLNKGAFVIAPGQTRPLPLNVTLLDPKARAFAFDIHCLIVTADGWEQVPWNLQMVMPLHHKSISEPHKVTHMHPGGMVSYAILRSPSISACSGTSAPVLLMLHGAGLEADNELVTHQLDPLPDLCAFVLFPTGVTPWSGDDWHTWGFADVEASIEAIPNWISATQWRGALVDINRWLVSGHSNGGQGTWYALAHRPDKVFAAAAVSGYLSIQSYVPYQLWQPMSPRRRAILEASANSYRHELLAANAQGVPILQQHGSADDNVPAFHSRFMSQALEFADVATHYNELDGKGHWFDGVMTTAPLQEFYKEQLNREEKELTHEGEFKIVVANPADMGPKDGIKVTHLELSGEYGRLTAQVSQKGRSYLFSTSNVLTFEIDNRGWRPEKVMIDGQKMDATGSYGLHNNTSVEFTKMDDGSWKITEVPLVPDGFPYRTGKQLGAMDAILATNGSFLVVSTTVEADKTALQISRNMYEYFYADAQIFSVAAHKQVVGKDVHESGRSRDKNRITVVVGDSDLLNHLHATSFPVQISGKGISIRDSKGHWRDYSSKGSVAAIFLRPLEGESLELVVWGLDAESLELAARLVPMMTGAGQPDFVVLSRSSAWKGVEGALAMGFFDHTWNVSSNSVLT